MNFKFFIYIGSSLFIIAVLGGFFALKNLSNDLRVDESKTVYIKKTEAGFQLIRNGEPFYIQGAGGESNFKELAEIGGNTIRLFDTANIQEKLDEAHKHNLAAIVDVYLPPYDKSYNLYDDYDQKEILKQNIRELVLQYKDHPALLLWNLGNEIKYPLVFRKNSFIKTFNELVEIIHEADPNHPVSTSIIGAGRKSMASIFIHSPKLDLVAFNTFGNTKFVNSHLAQVSFFFGQRPYYFSELGPDGPWESKYTSWGAPIEFTSSVKSELVRYRTNIIRERKDTACLGSVHFYWGSKLERTHTWFSLFKEGYKSEIISVIESHWAQSDNPPKPIGLDYMLVNNKSAYESIIFLPGELSEATLFFDENYGGGARVVWEIYPEAWYSDTSEKVDYNPIDTFVDVEDYTTTFLAPVREGPYRIFAYVYNQEGFFASSNTPFYVLKNK
ncbi:MAG: hypothetical protein LAT57_10070 [Balneolales bacterium]|nr:hypothetical protein [Balneolales bacterium]